MSLARLGFALAKPILHKMDAEQAHLLTIKALKTGVGHGAQTVAPAALKVKLFGLEFPNPIGLAPGFDKNAEVPDAMLAQGFGFVEIGTVTPRPQAGNARPRLFRLVEDQAVINRMGFNNEGHDAVLRRLEARRNRGGIVGVNIGANKDSDDRVADYVKGLAAFRPVASYITINISSPNTPGLRNMQGREELSNLLRTLNKTRPSGLPMLLKIAPDLVEADLQDVADVCGQEGVSGVIISNTTISRPALSSPLRGETGGLSGKPLFDLATRQLKLFHAITGGRLPLIGVGGISDAETAYAKIRAGASLIQLYSALVYQGPGLVQSITQGLTSKFAAGGHSSITDVVGT
ncbi:MAG: quinone-dependent dihydroorotate dehydrogenase [Alphaproteobacteria bacterium]|nr:quinone-dependent dihydroorotate dehydrogenase [Alphaproteobacteria bacterium]